MIKKYVRSFVVLALTGAIAALAGLGAGCALTSKAEPFEPRYFDIAIPDAPAKASLADGTATPIQLKIGRISAGAHLRNDMVYRTSAVELGTYGDLRWSERPVEYVRRAIDDALFSDGRLQQVVGGMGPRLEIELLAFEEVRSKGDPVARVRLAFTLHDDRLVLASGTITVEKPAPGGAKQMEKVVEAMGVALVEASRQLSDAVRAELTKPELPAEDPTGTSKRAQH